jgi:hypothetical protein
MLNKELLSCILDIGEQMLVSGLKSTASRIPSA